ncbi:hypothetical protein KDH_32550 [Dictyobacter sp. S3.2.2.5]|uniref:Tetratricopeptide repeat protein n=1 Tax=Dictyobacter halimunensis TaxID=3026934 RepID=A0ABQ6FV99_9CHLR|nr:hypothetical protein KDH_32550 [Dictyobacter sp. S3.2.2.5]
MASSNQRPWSPQHSWRPYRIIMPGAAGVVMLIASLCSWFNNPSGTRLMAWQMPVDLGWQLSLHAFNYGVLCASCALYIFFITYQSWRAVRAEQSADPVRVLTAPDSIPDHCYVRAMLLCLVPPALFLFQFLCSDMATIAEVTRQQVQLELARSHLGYAATPEYTPILPFLLDCSQFPDRFAILTDQLDIGWFMPLFSAGILLMARAFLPLRLRFVEAAIAYRRPSRCGRFGMFALALLLGAIIFGRAPAAMVSQTQAGHLLSIGDYSGALKWLDAARILNPELNQLVAYHLARGEAWFYLHPEQPNAESRAYLGHYYRTQKDFYTSYQTMLTTWHTYQHTPWLQDEVSLSLAQMAEVSAPLKGTPNDHLTHDEPALPWLNELLQINQSNFYAQFTVGRILYDLGDYAGCEAHMRMVLNISPSAEMQSAAYTYIALSRFDLGDNNNAREYLYKAQDLDPAYRNNTARQHMSGMR